MTKAQQVDQIKMQIKAQSYMTVRRIRSQYGDGAVELLVSMVLAGKVTAHFSSYPRGLEQNEGVEVAGGFVVAFSL